MTNKSDDSLEASSADASPEAFREYELGSRDEGETKRTFHVYKSETRIGYYLERIYDQNDSLICLIKRTQDGRSETRFNESGDVSRIFESYCLPDGNNLTKEKAYLKDERSKETVLVLNPNGILVRSVIRITRGMITLFQSQTEFSEEGSPNYSVNHWFDNHTGRLTHREQIQWLYEGSRGLTEGFQFNNESQLEKYHKVLYHPATMRYLEEIHYYDAPSQILLRKEIKTYHENDTMLQQETIIYDKVGNQIEVSRLFLNRS
jgi:hypothetical protein